jgi:hypothetical protein
MAQSHSLRSRVEAPEELLERERPSTIISISTPSSSIPLTRRAAPSARPKSLGAKLAFPLYGNARNVHVRIEGMIRMLNWEKSSGAEAPRNKISFFSPPPPSGFSKWTRVRSWVQAAS